MPVMIRTVENEGTYERSHKHFFELLDCKLVIRKFLGGKSWSGKIAVNQDGKEIKDIDLLRLIYANFKVFKKDGYDDFFMVREYIDDDGDCQHSPEIEVYIDRIDHVDEDDIKVLKKWGFA
tara:strand:- start:2440 stop:2802 length:363 start_codon:yes stop_codon:yes gene_type:complete